MHAHSTFKESKGTARNVKTLTAFFVRVVTLPLKKEVCDFWVCLSPPCNGWGTKKLTDQEAGASKK